MDFENSCLSQNWDNAKKQHPTGILRHADAEWAAMIKTQVYPHHSDVDWEEYCEWVSHGGGDEYFLEEDEPDVKMEKTANDNHDKSHSPPPKGYGPMLELWTRW